MSSNIKIPKNCQYCGQAFVAKTTTTRYCSKVCNNRHYKQLKREEKINAALNEQLNSVKTAKSQNLQNLQSVQSSTFNNINLKEKAFLSVQEAATLLGASRWTIQRMIKRDDIKAGKLGRRTVIPRTEIDNLFN